MFNKRGQTTIFIIVAIVIVAIVLIAFVVVPRFTKKESPISEVIDPEAYITDCINLELEPLVEEISTKGGYLDPLTAPARCIFYQGICRPYLCYTPNNFEACINQEPMLKEHIEKILLEKIREEELVEVCINNFKNAAQKKGWQTNTCLNPQYTITLSQGKINIPINCDITMEKGEETRNINEFDLFLEWPLFEFVMLTQEIINKEITNSNFDPLTYMWRNPNIEVIKFSGSNEAEIYTLKLRNREDEFVFAIRNYVIPQGVL